MPRHNPPLIAIVNHEPTFVRLLRLTIEAQGYQTMACNAGSTAHDQIMEGQPDLVVLDTWLETRDAGWALLQTMWLDEKTWDIPVLICSSDRSGFEQRAAQLEGKRVGVVHKPFHPDMLTREIRRVLDMTEGASPNLKLMEHSSPK